MRLEIKIFKVVTETGVQVINAIGPSHSGEQTQDGERIDPLLQVFRQIKRIIRGVRFLEELVILGVLE